MQLTNVTHFARNGSVTKINSCFIRGSHIRYVVLPDNLKNAAVFKKVKQISDQKVANDNAKRASRGRRGRGRG